jgi:protein-S-isoprenylcysteine O-methyltransferase Ste14
MNALIFNTSLLIGWVLIVVGVGGLWSVPAALLAGGVILVVVTLLLARWAGVQAPTKRTPHVPE